MLEGDDEDSMVAGTVLSSFAVAVGDGLGVVVVGDGVVVVLGVVVATDNVGTSFNNITTGALVSVIIMNGGDEGDGNNNSNGLDVGGFTGTSSIVGTTVTCGGAGLVV
jgi:hypothetical protein